MKKTLDFLYGVGYIIGVRKRLPVNLKPRKVLNVLSSFPYLPLLL
jgi:hypothetical protein